MITRATRLVENCNEFEHRCWTFYIHNQAILFEFISLFIVTIYIKSSFFLRDNNDTDVDTYSRQNIRLAS